MLENEIESEMVHYRRLFRLTARFYGLKVSDITAPNKAGPVRMARKIIAHILHVRRGLSYTDVGEIMCRDHSTVLHNVQAMERALVENPSLMEVIEAIDRGTFDLIKTPMPKPAIDRTVRSMPRLESQYATANFGNEERHMEKSWYAKQNQAYVEAVQREHGETARW
jgi:hypothetical protein